MSLHASITSHFLSTLPPGVHQKNLPIDPDKDTRQIAGCYSKIFWLFDKKCYINKLDNLSIMSTQCEKL